jgi:NADH dehydrogenase [ubiquinone] 1 alpha subcomplex assembly factor 7
LHSKGIQLYYNIITGDLDDKTPFIFAHEFFDALPIHAFESVLPTPEPEQKQQQQIMTPTGPVELNPPPKANINTPSGPQWRELMVALNHKSVIEDAKDEPEFQLSRTKISTPNSVILPELSERYKALKAQPGSIIEVSPESRIYMADFARRIGGFNPDQAQKKKLPNRKPGEVAKPTKSSEEKKKTRPSGAALILDYGTSATIPVNSLRGIRQHAPVSPFAFPGQADVSADVDFTSLAEAAIDASEGVEVHGPVDQADFLHSMGIAERGQQLVAAVAEADTEKQKTLETAWKRLVDKGPNGMGKLYKALVIVPENGGQRRPVGFGGSVVG